MRDGDILILKGNEVASLLDGREPDIIRAVRDAYVAHASGQSYLPHSTFVYFPDDPRSRIIALPAYLGSDFRVAGVKWVASFPANLERGLDRASAVLILNSATTGRPDAIIEASNINAKRTAASAALAAQLLHEGEPPEAVGVLGCGFINFEIVRFLRAALPSVGRLVVFDLDPHRAEQFKAKCLKTFGPLEVEVAAGVTQALSASPLVSFATTAGTPHLGDLSACAPGATLLHISLRDLSPEVILASDNVVDDADHVCRAQTSVHLAEQAAGNRDFIRCSLADVATGKAPARRDPRGVTVFSPFGLGVLDMAVGKLVRGLALEAGSGSTISSFLPDSWLEDK
jgi:N-[(2S)-2-amino-2-carboxyethyl]-L-glutamate dehydrogenase